jgi:putative ABC transport system permease protein
MNKLQRNLFRDLAASKGLFLAVTVVILLGVAIFDASSTGYHNLKSSYDYSYETLRFADFTVEVVAAPAETADELKSITGVEAVSSRISTDLPLTLPGDEAKHVLVRAISLPSGSHPAVNDVKVEQGSYFRGDEGNVILVEHSFAEYHKLNPRDSVQLTLDDREITFEVAGIVTSPEYILPAKSRQELLVSPESFGVIFVPRETLASLMGDSVVNEFCVIVAEGADRAAVIAEAEALLAPYGIMEIVTAEEQASNAALSIDIHEMGNMAQVYPLLFLIVGALVTYTLLARIVFNQRTQIGLMRAMGYSRKEVLIHYLSFALIIGVAGAVAGTVAGYLLSRVVTGIYTTALGLPYTRIDMEWLVIVEGLLLGIVPCVAAGILPALAASRLRPAEAMRTPAPAAGRKLFIEQIFPFLARLSHQWKIPLRNIFRNRRRSLYTVMGVAFGIALILVSLTIMESIHSFMSFQFTEIQKYDAQIAFAEPQPVTLVNDVDDGGDFVKVEPVLQVPVRLEHEGKNYTTMAIGLAAEAELYGLYSTDGDRVSVSDEGILLSGALIKTLDVHVGDVITLHSPSTSQQVRVAGFVKQPLGAFTFVTLEQAHELVGSQPVISGLMLEAKPEYAGSLRQKVSQIPGVASIEITSETAAAVGKRMDFNCNMIWIMFGFGAALSLAIVFTTFMISILERRREIATMRTLGESKGRIVTMLTRENLLLGLAGILLGIPLGYMLSAYFFSLLQTDMLSYSMVVPVRTYLYAAFTVILLILVSQIPAIRHVNRLNLSRVIKEQAS